MSESSLLECEFCHQTDQKQGYRIEQVVYQAAGIARLTIIEVDSQEAHGCCQVERRNAGA